MLPTKHKECKPRPEKDGRKRKGRGKILFSEGEDDLSDLSNFGSNYESSVSLPIVIVVVVVAGAGAAAVGVTDALQDITVIFDVAPFPIYSHFALWWQGWQGGKE